jgi:hypothetical protein
VLFTSLLVLSTACGSKVNKAYDIKTEPDSYFGAVTLVRAGHNCEHRRDLVPGGVTGFGYVPQFVDVNTLSNSPLVNERLDEEGVAVASRITFKAIEIQKVNMIGERSMEPIIDLMDGIQPVTSNHVRFALPDDWYTGPGFYRITGSAGSLYVEDIAIDFLYSVLPGDENGDGNIALQDLANLLASFGTANDPTNMFPDKTPICLSSDYTSDGTVDLTDLAILLSNYGMSLWL